MNPTRIHARGVLAGLALLLAAATPARAQGGLDADTFKHYGGTFLSDCKNPKSPRVTLFEDAIVFLEGDRRVAGSKVEPAAAWYGNSPPEGYLMAFLSETPGGNQLVLAIYEDASGRWAAVEGVDRKTDLLKFRACTPAKAKANAKATSEKAAPAAPPTEEEMSASGMLTVPKFKSAYLKALGARAKSPWLARLDGPSPQNRKVTVNGQEYLLLAACKNHECDDHNVVVLWSAARGIVYGMVHEGGKSAHIGGPPPAVARELGALWRAEWRSQP